MSLWFILPCWDVLENISTALYRDKALKCTQYGITGATTGCALLVLQMDAVLIAAQKHITIGYFVADFNTSTISS